MEINWAEFGIAGSVIGAMFVLVFFLLREHKSERKEWRIEAKKSEDRTVQALDKLTDAIKDRARPTI